MKASKLLSLLLTVAIVITFTTFPAFAETEPTVIVPIGGTASNGKGGGTVSETAITKLIDGLYTTYTQINPNNFVKENGSAAEYVFNFDKKYNFDTIEMVWTVNRATSVDVYVSDDGVKWGESVYTNTNITAEIFEQSYRKETFKLDEYAAGKFVKIVVNDIIMNGWPRITEVSFVGSVYVESNDEPAIPDDSDLPDISKNSAPLAPISAKASKMATGTATASRIIDGAVNWSSYYKTQDVIPVGNGTSAVIDFVFDFGEPVNITEVYMYWGSCRMTMGTVYVANTADEDTDWIPVSNVIPSYTAGDFGAYFTHNVSQPDYYRYVKIEATKLNIENCPALFETTFKGTAKSSVAVKYDVTPSTATSSLSGTGSILNTIDGSKTTSYQVSVNQGDGTTELVSYVYTFHDAYTFKKIKTLWGDTRGQGVTVYISNDTSKWGEPVYSTSDCDFAAETVGGSTAYSSSYDINNIKGRYVKIVVTKTNKTNASSLMLREVSFVGTTEPANRSERVFVNGSSIRLPDTSDNLPSGLRFAATIVKYNLGIVGKYEYSEDAQMKFGMFIIPEDLLGDCDTLTEYLEHGVQNALDVPARRIYEQNDNYVTFTAVLTNIPETHYSSNIIAVPYMLVDGKYTYFEEMTRSYIGVATDARSTTYSDSEIRKQTGNEKQLYEKIAAELDTLTNNETVDVRIMSYNILHPEWGEVAVAGRDQNVAATLAEYLPDVVGVQEVCEEWHLALKPLIVTTGMYAPVAKKFDNGEFNLTTMYYNPNTTRLVEEFIIPLKDNTDIRVLAGGVFEKRGHMFIVINTHPDTPTSSGGTYDADIDAIISQTTALMQKYPDVPIMMTGDYNSPKDLSFLYTGYNDIKKGLGVDDTRDVAQTVLNNYVTCPGINTKPSTYSGSGMSTSIIDYVFAKNVEKVLRFDVIYNTKTTATSDHLPIYADITIK